MNHFRQLLFAFAVGVLLSAGLVPVASAAPPEAPVLAAPSTGERVAIEPLSASGGPTLLHRLADEARSAGLPLPLRVLCTGHPGDAAALGVDAVLAKPVTLAALQRALQAGGVHPAAAVAA